MVTAVPVWIIDRTKIVPKLLVVGVARLATIGKCLSRPQLADFPAVNVHAFAYLGVQSGV